MLVDSFLLKVFLPFIRRVRSIFFGAWSVLLNRDNKFTLLSLHCLFRLLSLWVGVEPVCVVNESLVACLLCWGEMGVGQPPHLIFSPE